jgi:HD-GYP domain-containing protein (c-di-GMP phosphodiesterase class II)
MKGKDYTKIYQSTSSFINLVVKGEKPGIEDVYELYRVADIIVDSLLKSDGLVSSLFVEHETGDFVAHMIDVAIVATKIGLGLGYDRANMRDLLVCALLHDIGMYWIPTEILLKKDRLSKSEFEKIKQHPRYGYEALKDIEELNPVIAKVVYQEQEREDGSGYPSGLKGKEIHEYAKIIGLADIFVAMLQPRPQRGRMLPFDIVKEIIKTDKKRFPEYLIRTMIDVLSIFPVGLYVKLNTGEVGRVIRTNKLAPLKPVIEIIQDSYGRELKEPKECNLMKETLLRIEDAFLNL